MHQRMQQTNYLTMESSSGEPLWCGLPGSGHHCPVLRSVLSGALGLKTLMLIHNVQKPAFCIALGVNAALRNSTLEQKVYAKQKLSEVQVSALRQRYIDLSTDIFTAFCVACCTCVWYMVCSVFEVVYHFLWRMVPSAQSSTQDVGFRFLRHCESAISP